MNPDPQSIAAIFDLDGTLYDGHITRAFEMHHRTHHVKRINLLAFFGFHMPLWWLTKAGLISRESMRARWAADIPWLFRGWLKEEAQFAFQWIAGSYFLPRVYPDVRNRLEAHQAAGHRVILLSGTPSPLLEEIARSLNITESVGTPPRMRNGRYTGQSVPPVCQGEHKAGRLLEYIRQTDDIDLAESFAYADSKTDLAVLRLVGHPVVVRPDLEMAKIAQEAGWEVIQIPHTE